MLKILHSSWPLFFGLLLIMIGNGLQGTLLGVRASIEGFDTATIGFIMSLYYLGFLGGSYYVPRLISSVGHIRVFTALASLASATDFFLTLFFGREYVSFRALPMRVYISSLKAGWMMPRPIRPAASFLRFTKWLVLVAWWLDNLAWTLPIPKPFNSLPWPLFWYLSHWCLSL